MPKMRVTLLLELRSSSHYQADKFRVSDGPAAGGLHKGSNCKPTGPGLVVNLTSVGGESAACCWVIPSAPALAAPTFSDCHCESRHFACKYPVSLLARLLDIILCCPRSAVIACCVTRTCIPPGAWPTSLKAAEATVRCRYSGTSILYHRYFIRLLAREPVV